MGKTEATCATCQWWAKEGSRNEEWAECRHVSQMDADADPPTRGRRFWCNEHPDRKLPDVHELAARFFQMSWKDWHERRSDHSYADRQAAAARDAYLHADAMLAEAKRRRGE